MAFAAVTDRYSAEQIRKYYDAGYWRAQTMFEALEEQAGRQPDKVFVTDSTTSYTFRELRDAALLLGTGLVRRGIRPGDRIAVQLPNWTEFVVAALAISRIGAIIVPIMAIYRRDDVGFVVESAGVKAAFTPGEFRGFDHAAMFADIAAASATLETVIVVRGDAPAGPGPRPAGMARVAGMARAARAARAGAGQ